MAHDTDEQSRRKKTWRRKGFRILNKIRLKSLLFISSFLTYGLGDGITAAIWWKERSKHRGESTCKIHVCFIWFKGTHCPENVVHLCYSVTCMDYLKKNRSLLGYKWFPFCFDYRRLDGDARKCAGYAWPAFPSPGSIISTFCSWQYYSWNWQPLLISCIQMISRFIQYNSFDFIQLL